MKESFVSALNVSGQNTNRTELKSINHWIV